MPLPVDLKPGDRVTWVRKINSTQSQHIPVIVIKHTPSGVTVNTGRGFRHVQRKSLKR